MFGARVIARAGGDNRSGVARATKVLLARIVLIRLRIAKLSSFFGAAVNRAQFFRSNSIMRTTENS